MKKFLPLTLIPIFLISFKTYSLPKLSSFPSAKATIYFDFDGQTVTGTSWNGGATFYCQPAVLTDDQITNIFNRISEDYRPFNINITTDSSVFLAAPLAQRIRIIVTPSSDWYAGNVGGVSFTGSFVWGDDTPGFVFTNKLGNVPKLIAECCTHESGHTVGLSHQAKYSDNCNLVSTYNEGTGLGETSWAPVMGNSYYRNLSGWNNGPTPYGCTSDQDNLSIITSRNGFTYRQDDHGNNPADNPTILSVKNTEFSSDGIITTNTDKDAFKINLPKNGLVKIEASPYAVGPNNEGADLDIELTLLNSDMNVVQVYSPQEKLDVSVDTTLMAGDYFIVVNGSGNANTSNYGSLGSYRLAGTYSPLSVTPISQVLLSGEVQKDKHELKWSIIADEPIKSLTLESSSDGAIFNTLTNLSNAEKSFSYEPLLNENIFYRLKVISVTGQESYSNIVPLKRTEAKGSLINITSTVTSDITINASQNYQYQLADMGGRIIKTGKGEAGASNINIKNSPNGIYILQIICNSRKTTQRVLKL